MKEERDDGLRLGPAALLDELPPWTLGGIIEIGPEIASGAMGVVYRGRHTRLDRDVAVKMLSADLLDHPDHLARFESEARTLASLSHSNIVAVHDYIVEDGHPFLVMELIDGRSLAEESLELPRAVDAVIAVCRALEHSHDRGVIHRDVKPANVLMTRDGEVKLGDFGVAALARDADENGQVHGVAGSRRFMAPEVLAGAQPAPSQDIYAVGVLLQELLSRTASAPGRDFAARLDAIVEKATMFAPERRFASAAELRVALEAARAEPARELPVDETTWLRVVAGALTAASGVVGWMLVVSLTPRLLEAGEAQQLTVLRGAPLGDGRVASMARLEVPLALLAVGAVAVAGLAYGFLRRHWRREGLETHEPDVAATESRPLMWLSVASNGLYAGKLALRAAGQAWAQQYVPLLGGLLLLCALYVFWMGMLDTARRNRPLAREWRLVVVMAVCLLPVLFELIEQAWSFRHLY